MYFVFDIPQILIFLKKNFNKTWNFDVILIHVFRNIDSMYILLCEFFVVSKYDEMNCNFISRVFFIMFYKV